MFNLGFGGFQGFQGAVPQAYQPQMQQRQMGSMMGGYQPRSIYSNPIANRSMMQQNMPQQNGNTPYQFGYGMMPMYPGYTLPQMGNQPNPFLAGNQPIKPVGDVLNPNAPPAQAPAAGGMDQAMMMKAMNNWQNAQRMQENMYDGGGVGQGQYGNMADRFAKDPKLMQSWADNSRAGRMLGDPWAGY